MIQSKLNVNRASRTGPKIGPLEAPGEAYLRAPMAKYNPINMGAYKGFSP